MAPISRTSPGLQRSFDRSTHKDCQRSEQAGTEPHHQIRNCWRESGGEATSFMCAIQAAVDPVVFVCTLRRHRGGQSRSREMIFCQTLYEQKWLARRYSNMSMMLQRFCSVKDNVLRKTNLEINRKLKKNQNGAEIAVTNEKIFKNYSLIAIHLCFVLIT